MNEILIYDDIGAGWFDEGITGASIKDQLDAFSDGEDNAINVRINSPGGDVFEGFAIYNLLSQYKGDVTVHVDGLAASAASIIAMAGNIIVMGKASMMMIHDPWTIALGDADEFIKTADTLEKIKDSIVSAYVDTTGIESAEISDLMSAETWFTAEDAVEQGFANHIAGESTIENSVMNRQWIKNAPKPDKKDTIKPEIQQPEYRIAARARLSAL